MSIQKLTLRVCSHTLLNFPRRGLISSETFEQIVPSKQMKEYVLSNEHFAFILLSITFSSQPSHFIQAIIVDQGENGELLVSKTFPYPLEDCSYRIIKPRSVLLQNIIIQSLDFPSLQHSMQTEDFTRSVINYERGVVLGEGDELTMTPGNKSTYKYRIVHTFPFKQGVLSPLHAPETLPQRIIILPTTAQETRPSMPDHLSQSRIQTNILSDHSPFQKNALSSMLGSLSLLPRRVGSKSSCVEPLQFVIKRLELPLHIVNPPVKYRDIHHEIFATMKTLSDVQIASGSWVLLRVYGVTKKKTARGEPKIFQYPARIFAVDLTDATNTDSQKSQEFKDGRIYAPPLVLFRLGVGGVQEFSNIRTYVTVSPFIRRHVSKNHVDVDFPCARATKIVLARVRAPNSAIHVSPQELRSLLSEPRILCQGDILAVPRRRLGYLQFEELVAEPESSKNSSGSDQSQNSQIYDELIDSIHALEGVDAAPRSYCFFHVSEIQYETEQLANASEDEDATPPMGYVSTQNISVAEKSAINSSLPTCYEDFISKKIFLPPPGTKTIFNELLTILSPFLSNQEQISGMHCSVLLHGIRANGKRTLVHRLCKYLGIHILEINCFDLLGQGDTETTEGLRICFEQAQKVLPCILLLRHIEALEKLASQQQREPQVASALRECISPSPNESTNNFPIKLITIATASKLDQLSSSTRSCFRHEVLVGVPEELQRRQITKSLLQAKNDMLSKASSAQSLRKSIALRTAGYSAADLQSLVSRAHLNIFSTICGLEENSIRPSVSEMSIAGLSLVEECFDDGFRYLQKAHAEELGAPKIPNVQWDDVGGLIKAKKEILDTIQLPLEHPELFSHGVRQRSGVLLYGPPGSGKTLLAKAVATECSLNFMSVKGPELLNMYVGESEKNVRDVFEKARNAKPCVVFFDELDSLAPNRGQGSDSGGVMDRVVSQLLAELDGMQKAADVFIIGATNRPDLLDSALLRPGRLDRLVYLGVSETLEEQIPILRALTRKFDLADDVDLNEIASLCPTTFTGADFYALCSDTLLNATKERIDILDKLQKLPNISEEEKQNYIEISQNENLLIQKSHFIEALRGITPSVSPSELERYKKVRDQFS